jgi:Amt family ammonium transporter
VGAIFVWATVCGAVLFTVLKATVGLRVTPEEEADGLDLGEHGNEAYHGFQFVAEPR